MKQGPPFPPWTFRPWTRRQHLEYLVFVIVWHLVVAGGALIYIWAVK